jgi:hypothetical protein
MDSDRLTNKFRSGLVFLSFNILFLSQIVSADVCPFDRVGSSNYGLFVNQSNVTLEKFYVDVSVNLPEVHEEYTYHLRNNANETIYQEVIIPVVFGLYRIREYKTESMTLYVNGINTSYRSSTEPLDYVLLDDPDLKTDVDRYAGVTTRVKFPPLEEVEIKLVIDSWHNPTTESFQYFYSAKTARYWSDKIKYGSFQFEYESKYTNITYDVPNGRLEGSKLTSIMEEWDGNSTYYVNVDTGIRCNRSNQTTMRMVIFGAGILLITVPIIIAILLIRRHIKKRQKG